MVRIRSPLPTSGTKLFHFKCMKYVLCSTVPQWLSGRAQNSVRAVRSLPPMLCVSEQDYFKLLKVQVVCILDSLRSMLSFQYKSCFYIGSTNIKYVRVFPLFICIDAFKKLNSQFNNKNLLDWITGQGGQLSMGKKVQFTPNIQIPCTFTFDRV